MKLDASALKALNLMPNPQELGGNKNMSLFGLLNRMQVRARDSASSSGAEAALSSTSMRSVCQRCWPS